MSAPEMGEFLGGAEGPSSGPPSEAFSSTYFTETDSGAQTRSLLHPTEIELKAGNLRVSSWVVLRPMAALLGSGVSCVYLEASVVNQDRKIGA